MPNVGIVAGGHSGREFEAVFKVINGLFQGFICVFGFWGEIMRDA
jgi:hypothetical protein